MLGYSARYHVASLAAIFLALGIGILIGTGLGKNVVSDTTRKLENSLKGDLESARSQASTLRGQLRQQQDFSQAVYPALTRKQLPGMRIAVIALGGLDESLRGNIKQVVGQENNTGARVHEFAVVSEPPDVSALNADVRGTRLHPLKRGKSLATFGRADAHVDHGGGPGGEEDLAQRADVDLDGDGRFEAAAVDVGRDDALPAEAPDLLAHEGSGLGVETNVCHVVASLLLDFATHDRSIPSQDASTRRRWSRITPCLSVPASYLWRGG